MKTITKKTVFCEEIKKSRFIATAVPITSAKDAMENVSFIKDTSATHNCFAYRVNGEHRFSDDGEPGGTAGRPILSAIEGKNMDRILVVVTRFFGGTKLGAGGLVRAYGGTASKCLSSAELVEIIPKITAKIVFPFDVMGNVHSLIDQYNCEKLGQEYLESGVNIILSMNESAFADFKASISNATRGKAVLMALHPTEPQHCNNDQKESTHVAK